VVDVADGCKDNVGLIELYVRRTTVVSENLLRIRRQREELRLAFGYRRLGFEMSEMLGSWCVLGIAKVIGGSQHADRSVAERLLGLLQVGLVSWHLIQFGHDCVEERDARLRHF